MRYRATFGLVTQRMMIHRADCYAIRRARVCHTFEANSLDEAYAKGLAVIESAPRGLFYLDEGMTAQQWVRVCVFCERKETRS
jgi:hypothetical protein